jgi:voltage-gated potassium channel
MGWVRWLRLMAIVGLIIALYFLAPVSADARGGVVARTIGALLVLAALVFGVVHQLRAHVDDTSRRLDGLVASIVVVVVVFSLAFYVLDVHHPDQLSGLHTRLDSLYFTASTLATVGYGDVHAVGQAARALVLVQLVFNVVFVATAAGLLSARVRSAVQQRSQERSTQRNAS